MRRLSIIVVITLSLCANAQNNAAVPVFDTYEWDFGTISEADGPVSHTFHLLNNSNRNVAISRAIPGCSCINAVFLSTPVEPGKMTDVVVTYSPSGAVGDTYRTIEIVDTEGRSLGTLSTKANVVPADRSIQERYFYTLADMLYANKTTLPFGYVYQGKIAQKQVYIANASDKAMNLDVQTTQTPELRAVAPYRLEAGRESAITITYTIPDDKNLFRTYSDTVWIVVDGTKARVPVVVSAIAMAKPAESAEKPDMQTYPSVGKMSAGWLSSRLSGTIELTNNGKADLVIYKVESPASVTVNIASGTVVKPGRKIEVKAETDAGGKFSVNLFTNDPQRPYKELIFSNNNN